MRGGGCVCGPRFRLFSQKILNFIDKTLNIVVCRMMKYKILRLEGKWTRFEKAENAGTAVRI